MQRGFEKYILAFYLWKYKVLQLLQNLELNSKQIKNAYIH